MGNGGLIMLRTSNDEEEESMDEEQESMHAMDDWKQAISPYAGGLSSSISPYASGHSSSTSVDSVIGIDALGTLDITVIQKTSAQSVTIEGALGIYAKLINACFVQNGQMYNGRMLYQSLSNPGYWLWYTRNGRWMVSSTKDRDLNMECGFCHCKAFGLPDPSHTKGWFVLGSQGRFRRQTRVAARTSGKKESKLQNVQVSGKKESKLQDVQVSDKESKPKDVQVSDKESKPQDVQVSDKESKPQDVQVSNKELKPQDVQDPKSADGETQSTQDALPIVVKFQGVTGFYASAINGVYMCKRGESIEAFGFPRICHRFTSQGSAKSANSQYANTRLSRSTIQRPDEPFSNVVI